MINIVYCDEVSNETKEKLNKLANSIKKDDFSKIITTFNNEMIKHDCKLASVNYDRGSKLEMEVIKNEFA